MSEKRTAKKARAIVRRVLGGLLVLAIVAALVVAWMPKPVAVDVATVATGDLRVTVDEDGRTRVKDRYVVGAPLTGNAARIELDPGDAVHLNDVLVRIVPLASPLLDARSRVEAEARAAAAGAQERQVRASIERARVSMEFAQREVTRQRGLAASGASSSQAAERAEMEVRTLGEEIRSLEFGARVAEHQARLARVALGRFDPSQDQEEQLEVTAPVEGQVLRVIQESAGVVAAGTPLLELGDPAALEIVVDVLTSDAVRIQPGAHVSLERWGGEGELAGHVRRVEPSAFTRVSALGVEEQRVNVVIDLDEPRERWRALGDGYRVETRIVVWEQRDVLKVPASAIFRHGDGHAVFRVEGGHARVVAVQVGEQNGVETQITGGLREGDRVVVHPSDAVVDGAEVAPRG